MDINDVNESKLSKDKKIIINKKNLLISPTASHQSSFINTLSEPTSFVNSLRDLNSFRTHKSSFASQHDLKSYRRDNSSTSIINSKNKINGVKSTASLISDNDINKINTTLNSEKTE